MAATTIAEKIAEIERKQNFTSDWFEESLQEMLARALLAHGYKMEINPENTNEFIINPVAK